MQGAASLQVVRLMSSYLEGGVVTPTVPAERYSQDRRRLAVGHRGAAFEWQGYCNALDCRCSAPIRSCRRSRKARTFSGDQRGDPAAAGVAADRRVVRKAGGAARDA